MIIINDDPVNNKNIFNFIKKIQSLNLEISYLIVSYDPPEIPDDIKDITNIFHFNTVFIKDKSRKLKDNEEYADHIIINEEFIDCLMNRLLYHNMILKN